MRLSKLLQGIEKVNIVYGEKDWEREIIRLTTDSRGENQDGLFFCLTGGKTDAHAFAAEAIRRGAAAIVVERVLQVDVPQIVVNDSREALALMSATFYGNPSENLKVIGITGTNGKTTTSYMLAEILKEAGKSVGVIGTLGVRFGECVSECDLTTPDPIPLQKTLAEMFLRGVEYVVMEVSAHALYYKKTAGVRFTACIFTNLTQDHLDFFGDMTAYKKAKTALFSNDICPIAILNGDDETGRYLGGLRGDANTLYYGLHTPSDAFAIVTDETLDKTECVMNINDEIQRVSLSFAGKHNVYNALAAASCAVALGVDLRTVGKGLFALQGVKGRLERICSVDGADIFVDFAHTPDGLEQSLTVLRRHCKGRLLCIFGCGGNRDKSKRSIMGETVAKKCDFAVLTSDNPRYEDPLDILSEIEKGYRRFSVKYVVVSDREKAIEYGMNFLRKGDVLLVAGKGGENYQEIMGIKYPFNDNDIIEKIRSHKGEKIDF